MDSLPTYNDFPWELIISALQGELSPDEDLQFRQWLALSQDNRKKYDQLQQIWKNGLADYIFYQQADEVKAWESLRERLGDTTTGTGDSGPMISIPQAVEDEPVQEEAIVIEGSFKRASLIRRLTAVAAIFLLTAGIGYWYLSGKSAIQLYETAANEQKKIFMPDGSTIVLKPQTSLQFAGSYNKASRTVTLISGEAFFEVSHQDQLPFIVDMGAASIKDIGTSFTVKKTKDSIKVIVFSGKVAFIKKETGEWREISAGNSLSFYITDNHFGEIVSMDPSSSGAHSLKFDNTPLSDVIDVLQKVSGKKVLLNDTALAQKRLTAHLDGESFDNALKVICSSLNLDYTEKNGVYILRNKDAVTH